MNSKFFYVFSLVMTVAYIIFGVFIAAFADLPQFSKPIKIGLGILIIAYGCFRGYRAYKITRINNNTQQ
jgi:hypothetical protein